MSLNRDRNYKYTSRANSVLVAGSNQGGNFDVKLDVIRTLKDSGYEVHHTCDIFNSYNNSDSGNEAVLLCLAQCDFYYVVASEDGYVGQATAARMAFAHSLPFCQVVSSHELDDPDLQFYVKYRCAREFFYDLETLKA